MSRRPPVVPLQDLIRQRKSFISIEDQQTYKRCRVQLHARGIVLRDVVQGMEVKTKKQQVCRAGDLLVAEIDAKVGGFGIVPERLTGAIVSSHYFLFNIDETRLDPGFLDLCLQTRAFQDQVSAQGSTNYAAIRPNDVLGYRVPLPPIEEQRRIVSIVTEATAALDHANGRRAENVAALDSLFAASRAEIFRKAAKSRTVSLEDAAELARGKFSHRPRNDPRFFGGEHPWIQIGEIEAADGYIVNWTESLNDEGLAISRKFPRGTILISIAATIGAVGILDFDCCIPDSIVAIVPHSSLLTEFVYHYLSFLRTHLEDIAPQSAQKNVNLAILRALPIPMLPVEDQRRVVEYLNEFRDAIKSVRKVQQDAAKIGESLRAGIINCACYGST